MNANETRAAWKRELQRTNDCIAIERLAEELTPDEHSHLAHCARCQAELTLWQHINDEEQTLGEAAAVASIAANVRSRMASSQQSSNVVRIRRTSKVAAFRAPLAAAALLVIAFATGVFVTNREPAVDGTPSVMTTYRSASVVIVAPSGDVKAAPSELQWKSIADATRYDVRVMEVDRTVLWRGSTSAARIDLPPAIVAQFVPGKTILWQVQASRDQAIVADSGIQRFRVAATH